LGLQGKDNLYFVNGSSVGRAGEILRRFNVIANVSDSVSVKAGHHNDTGFLDGKRISRIGKRRTSAHRRPSSTTANCNGAAAITSTVAATASANLPGSENGE